MANKTYTLDVRWTGEQFEAAIPELGRIAVGSTFQEAVENGERAIVAANVEAFRSSRKPRQTRKRRNVA